MTDREDEILLRALELAGSPTRMIRLTERGHQLLRECASGFEARCGKRVTYTNTCEVALELLKARLEGLPDE